MSAVLTPSGFRARSLHAEIPDGERVYAIGDIHGRADLLTRAFAKIDAHRLAYPAPTTHEILMGDYIDRGPQSRQVIEMIRERAKKNNVVALAGNHEEILLRSASDPNAFRDWMQYGGREALMSYGIMVPLHFRGRDVEEAMMQMQERIPAEHFDFFEDLPAMHLVGDYVFVHAGLRPNVRLTEQTRRDVLWIRQGFLNHRAAFPGKVVHGHTPVRQPEIHPNRINIDTGAFITGNLTCLVLEGEQASFL